MKRLLTITAVVCLALLMFACGELAPTADDQQRAQTEQIAQQSNAQAGMPGVANFTEKKLMKMLYELRDKEIATYTYMPDMNGRLWHVCDSVGYGLPYGTQFSNPEKHANIGGAENPGYNLPQPEPNGLFMPPAAEGTWVMCGAKGDIKPVYVEPRVIVSPFKLQAAGEYQKAINEKYQ